MRKEKLQAIKMKAGRHARGSPFGRAGEERSDETERAMSKVIIFRQKGDWKKTRDFLKRCSEMQLDDVLDRYGQEGVDYINPAMRPIFDRIAARAWGEVRRE